MSKERNGRINDDNVISDYSKRTAKAKKRRELGLQPGTTPQEPDEEIEELLNYILETIGQGSIKKSTVSLLGLKNKWVREAKIEELEKIPKTHSFRAYVDDRLSALRRDGDE